MRYLPAYKDEDRNTWYVQFYYTDWTGKRRKTKKRGFKTQRDAKAYEKEFLNKETQNCDMTFASLVELYMDDLSNRLKESTISSKKFIIDKKILPYFKNLRINAIQATHIRKWQNELMNSKENYAPTYLKTINNQLSAIMNYAVKYYRLPNNPCRAAGSMGKKNAGEMEIWTLEEFNQFISAVDKPAMKLAFEIMFWAGLRVGETIALTPADILPEKIIDINKTLYRVDGENRVYDPKTEKSARKVPIPDFLYDNIQTYINSIYEIQATDYIFYFTKSTLNKNLDYYAAKSGVKRIRVHDLRHSHASLLIEMGQPILLISERLGHEKVDTTWSTYAHLYPDKGIKLADALQKMGRKDS